MYYNMAQNNLVIKRRIVIIYLLCKFLNFLK